MGGEPPKRLKNYISNSHKVDNYYHRDYEGGGKEKGSRGMYKLRPPRST